ncbi:DUF2339 domain-containing protein [Janibacter corallicola]|uniref:DUF2339 domain-containing protein n=1 Tax=Janibacter corallicola TaxID=415212 RepID=UPI000A045F77|nr:DUF2339 domain-containing protein [Janibacter corallicola]
MSFPGGPTLDEIRRLEDDFAAAMTRMHSFGNDLARLRSRLASEAAAAPPTTTPPAPATATTAPPTPVPPPPPGPGVVSPPPPPASGPAPGTEPSRTPAAPSVPLWQREGFVVRTLAVVGAAITLIGVAFLLAIAISIGIFGPLPRVLSGALLAVGLVAAAERVRRRQQGTAGAIGLAATGFATAYLDVLAVSRIYERIPAGPGLVLAGGIALVGVLIARSWGSELLASLTVLGVALLAPFVGSGEVILTGSFLLVLTTASWAAQIGPRWHLFEVARVLPSTLYLMGVSAFGHDTGAAALLGLLLALVVLGVTLAGELAEALPRQLNVLVPVAAVPVVLAAVLLEHRVQGTALLVVLALGLILLSSLADRSADLPAHLRHREVALPAAGLASLLAALTLAEGGGWAGPTTVLVALCWALAALALRDGSTHVVALGVAGLCVLGSLVLLPYVLLSSWAYRVQLTDLLTVLGIVLTALVLTGASRADVLPHEGIAGRAAAALAVLWGGGLAVLAGALIGQLADAPDTGVIAGQAAATVLWLVIAAALIRHGLRHASVGRTAGLALAALGVAKLLIFDLAFLDGIARVLSFIVGGLLLLAMGAGYARAVDRSQRPPTPPVDNSGRVTSAPPTV